MKKLKNVLLKGIAVLFVMTVMAFSFSSNAKAGFGDFNDYDSGGSWDSGSDWDYDSDWGSSDYSWSSDSYDSGSGGTSFCSVAIIVLIIIVIGIICYARENTKNKNNNNSTQQATTQRPQQRVQKPMAAAPADRTIEISNQIKQRDPLFAANDFLSFAQDVYMDIQDAWEKRNLEPVRAVLHQNLYQQTEKQIQKKIADGIVNHLERISVNKSYLMDYNKDEKYEYLHVYLAASMIDYQVKEATGQILYGDKTTRWNMQYKMTFMRSVDCLTKDAKDKEKGLVCPNCGAPLTGTSFGKCEYCGSIVTTGAYDWVLSGFTAIK